MSQRKVATDWLIAIRAPGLGARRLRTALAKHGDIQSLLRAARLGRSGLHANIEQALVSPDEQQLAGDLQWLDAAEHHLLCWGDEWYPDLLTESDDAPAFLFAVGDLAALWRPQVAMVGSRNASRDGQQIAGEFAYELATRGFVITSGMAKGIDATVHDAALRAGGQTVAVLGTGPDQVYPKSHWQLAQRIVRSGVLVTEYPPGVGAHSGHFPTRNRIISGLSLGVLVVEAGLKSGSLITARLAAEQGREVLAIPGPVFHPLSQGCHQLIREGARLAGNIDHVLEALGPLAARLADRLRHALAQEQQRPSVESEQTSPQVSGLSTDPRIAAVQPISAQSSSLYPDLSDLDEEYRSLLVSLGTDALIVDEIVTATNLTPEAVSSMLLILELRGLVVCHDGGKWRRHHEIAL